MVSERCYACLNKLPDPQSACPHCGADNRDLARRQPGFALPCGTVLMDRYIVGRYLGRGGFGITYVGWNLAMDTRVCIKEYFPDKAAARSREHGTTVYWYRNANTEMVRRGYENFITEARKAARIRDLDAVVNVWDAFQANDTAYIVMDYIEGMTIKEYLMKTGRPLSGKECVQRFSGVMNALAEIHRRGIIHRDISPDNLLLCPDGKIVLLDLGAAKDLYRGSEQSSFIIGKRGFTPLERYTHKSKIGPWTDVYSLCATIYYCMTGRLVPEPMDRFSGMALDMSGIKPGMAAVLERGLTIEWDKRIGDMDELQRQLQAAVQEEEGTAEPGKLTAEAAVKPERENKEREAHEVRETYETHETQGERPPEQTQDAADKEKRKKRRKVLLPFAAVLTALFLAAGALFLYAELTNTDLLAPLKGPMPQSAVYLKNGREQMAAGNDSQALEYFIQTIEAGDASAVNEIKALYEADRIPEADEGKALLRLAKSADTGNGAAMTAIGGLYADGLGVPADSEKAQAWYRKGIDAGDSFAANQLGELYRRGLGVEQDYKQAVAWYRMGAAAGDDEAMNSLGCMFLDGLGVDVDYEQARKYLKDAADEGNVNAMYRLGLMYQNGTGVAEDRRMALKWFHKAADIGSQAAMEKLRELGA